MTHRFEVSTAAGLDAHSISRMREMIRQDDDFQDLKQIFNDGFGHIRIPIDPVALGLFENSLTPDLVPGNAPIFGPLYEDIREAQEAGLMVILDFHPVVISAQNYSRRFTPPGTIPPGKEYTGRYLYHYLDGVGSPNHPLAKVWQSFVQGLDAYFVSQGAALPTDTVVLELLNEPYENLFTKDEANLSRHLPPHLIADDPTTGVIDMSHIGWRTVQMREFRNIMLHAARAVHNVNSAYRIIVSQHLQLPYGPDNINLQPQHTAPYTGAEFPELTKLIYAWHLYEPMKFTHVNRVDGPDEFLDYNYARDFTGTVLGNTYDCHYFLPGLEPALVANNVIKTWSDNHNAQFGFYPQIVFTEFGAQIRSGTLFDDADNDGPSGQAGPPLSRPLQRTQWYFDTRVFTEKIENSGWSAYEYIGDMSLYRGTFSNPARMYHPSNYNLHGYRGELKQYIKQALFGVSRPTQAD